MLEISTNDMTSIAIKQAICSQLRDIGVHEVTIGRNISNEYAKIVIRFKNGKEATTNVDVEKYMLDNITPNEDAITILCGYILEAVRDHKQNHTTTTQIKNTPKK